MTLRILSYNILAGGEDRLPLISSVIQKQQPDVVALLEARSLSNAEALAQQLEMSLTVGEADNVNRDHVVWLSRLPVLRANNHRHPVFAKTLLEIATLKKWGEDRPEPQFPRQVIPLLLDAGYVDCYRTLHPGILGYTSHTAHPALRIDYIFAAPSFAQRLQACDIVTGSEAISASDHFPVWAEFK